MNPDQQQTASLLSQTTHTNQRPAVANAVSPTNPGAPPGSTIPLPAALTLTPRKLFSDLLGTSIKHGALFGLKYGAVYGAILGLYGIIGGLLMMLVTVPSGAVIGAALGAGMGTLTGIITGLTVSLITLICFYPRRLWIGYRQKIGAISVLVMLIPPMLFRSFFNALGNPTMIMLLYIPLLVACVAAWLTSMLVAERYAELIQVNPDNGLSYGSPVNAHRRRLNGGPQPHVPPQRGGLLRRLLWKPHNH